MTGRDVVAVRGALGAAQLEIRCLEAEVERLTALHVTEWAVLSDDGTTYEVEGKARARAHYEAAGLRLPHPEEGGYREPTARVVECHICSWAGTTFHEPDINARAALESPS